MRHRKGARGKNGNAAVTLRRYPDCRSRCRECACDGVTVANRNLHRAGARRHRVDHRMRGSCVGAPALNHEVMSNALASGEPPRYNAEPRTESRRHEVNELADRMAMLAAQ